MRPSMSVLPAGGAKECKKVMIADGSSFAPNGPPKHGRLLPAPSIESNKCC